MLKHIPSEADLDLIIDDDGYLFIFCAQVNKVWTGKLTPGNLPPRDLKAREARQAFKKLAMDHGAMLKSIGVNANAIDTLIK
jgi:hypothetical protein